MGGSVPVAGGEDAARRYHRLQLVLGAVGLALGSGYLLAVIVTGAGSAVARAAAGVWGAPSWQVAAVVLALGGGYGLLTFPLAWVRGFWLPRRYGLLHQPFRGWLTDRLKSALLGAGLALVSVEVVYALVGWTPLWWLVAAGIFLLIQVALAVVFPVWVLPLFYRLTPLGDEALRGRLLHLAERAGVRAVGVWVADQSRRSRTANAALAGLGRTRRIVLFDTLIAQFAPEEVEAVLAHELAHHVHRDAWRGLAVQTALTVVMLWVADRALHAGVALLGLAGPADPGGVPWLALVLGALGLVTTPLANGFSRRMERQADDFALALTRDARGFVGAMERLASLNLAERRPHRLKELLFFSHPSVDRRIARALRATP
jgi:STE24 endopeptidase